MSVGALAAPELELVVCLAAITSLTMLNWSATCCSLKALAPLGSAEYHVGAP